MWNSTKKYSDFCLIESNRMINPLHVTRLSKSIVSYGVLRPVIVDSKFRILDGQHLFYALKNLNLPIYYIQVNDKTPEDLIKIMSTLNNVSRPWRLVDYLNLWKEVNPVYKKLEEKIKLTGFHITHLIAIHNNTEDTAAFKQGVFTFDDEKLGDTRTDQVRELLNYIGGYKRSFDTALAMVKINDYNHLKMVGKLKNHSISFPEDKVNVMKSILKAIYNS